MTVELTDDASNLVLDWLLAVGTPTRPSGCYVAIGTGATAAGLTGEPVGSGYARQAATFSAAAGRATANTNTITFGPCTGTAWGSITKFGIYSASTGGTCLFAGSLDVGKTVGVGDSVSFAVGEIDIASNAYSD